MKILTNVFFFFLSYFCFSLLTKRKLQEAVSSLQQELKESEDQTVRLVDDSRLQQRQLANANREKDELVKTIEEQKKTIAKRDREVWIVTSWLIN